MRFHKFVSPSGYYDEEYVCEAKKFFLPMIPGMRVGGWKGDCMNGECSSHSGGKCQHVNDDAWCDMAIVPARDDLRAEGCTCSVDHCPFFHPRTADEWMSAVRRGEVPFLTRNGRLRQEAKNAKNYFALSDEVFDGLVEEMKARLKKKRGEE
jgi:hypothetical protein